MQQPPLSRLPEPLSAGRAASRLELVLPDFRCEFIPLIVTAAVWNRLKPSIGRIRCLTRRWSCSIPLFKYLHERTRTVSASFLLLSIREPPDVKLHRHRG